MNGKSSIFDILFNIRRLLIDNARISDLFSEDDLTVWVNRKDQSFEFDVQDEMGLFTYKITIFHNPSIGKLRIETEELLHEGKPLFKFDHGQVQLYHDDHTIGPSYTYDWTLSALATIVPRPDNKKLTRFKERIDHLYVVSLQPKAMTAETAAESDWLNRDGTNFASWYRYISQEYQDKIFTLTKGLREIIPGFHAFKLEQAGKHRILKVGFTSDEFGPVYFDFDKLSDGQRVLIVLYTLVLALQNFGHVLFLDEPENYISLPEIQPWLMKLNDICQDSFPQAVLISHHPELIDYFAPECGIMVDRDPLGSTRKKELPNKIEGGLKLSEMISRGWE